MFTHSGDAALSPDQKWLAISNLSTGFDIYRLQSLAPAQKLSFERHVKTKKACLPVTFLHRNSAVLGGSSFGTPVVWDLESEKQIHILDHKGKAMRAYEFLPVLTTCSDSSIILALSVSTNNCQLLKIVAHCMAASLRSLHGYIHDRNRERRSRGGQLCPTLGRDRKSVV